MVTIADLDPDAVPTMAEHLLALRDVTDRGIHADGAFRPWRDVVEDALDLAAALPAELAGAGLPAGAPPHVGVLLDNSREFFTILAAAALGGCVVVALNPTRSGPDLATDIRRTHCALLVTDSGHAPALAGAEPPSVLVDGPDWERMLRRGREIREAAAGTATVTAAADPAVTVAADRTLDDLVLLVFTSGTSGTPKAVRVTQRKITLPGLLLRTRFGITAADVVYCAMPLFHSNSVMVAWPVSVGAGASLVLRRRFSASAFLPDIRRYGATFANYVGTPLSYILATPTAPDDADNPLRIMYGNEAGARDSARFSERFGCLVVDGFGSTEGGISISRTPDTPPGALGPPNPGTLVVDPDTDEPRAPGRLDEHGRLLNPEEAIGELVNTAGAGQFAGYHEDPDADAERMRGGWYRSGDLAFIDEAGFAHFVGRTSGWLRVAGENLGTAPIEAAIRRHPDVAEAAVYGVPAEGPGDRVMTAVVLRPGVEPDVFATGFARFLTGCADLAPRQWPSFLRVTASLPRTASFKIRPRALAEEAWRTADPVWWRPNPGDTDFVPHP